MKAKVIYIIATAALTLSAFFIGKFTAPTVIKTETPTVLQTDNSDMLDFIRCSKDDESMRQLMTKDPEYGKMEEDAYNMAAAYTGTENLLAVKDDYIEGGRVNMCKAIDDLILKGKLEGRVEGVRKEL